jgi:hypothetical protein
MAIGQMQVGDEGYCPVAAVYVAPCSPRAPAQGRDVASTARFLFPDAAVCSEASPRAKARIRRLEDGFSVRLPPGEVPSRYLRQARSGSFPVIAIE